MKALDESAILRLQDHAIRTGDSVLRATCWIALGRDSRYAFTPVTEGEQRRAATSLAATLACSPAVAAALADLGVSASAIGEVRS